MADESMVCVSGVLNGLNSYKTQKGVVVYEALVVIPNSESCLRIKLKEGFDPSQFVAGKKLEKYPVRPSFYNGRLQGLEQL